MKDSETIVQEFVVGTIVTIFERCTLGARVPEMVRRPAGYVSSNRNGMAAIIILISIIRQENEQMPYRKMAVHVVRRSSSLSEWLVGCECLGVRVKSTNKTLRWDLYNDYYRIGHNCSFGRRMCIWLGKLQSRIIRFPATHHLIDGAIVQRSTL